MHSYLPWVEQVFVYALIRIYKSWYLPLLYYKGTRFPWLGYYIYDHVCLENGIIWALTSPRASAFGIFYTSNLLELSI